MSVPTLTPPLSTAVLAANLAGLRARIAAAARRSGRDPGPGTGASGTGSVRIVAVTKSVTAPVAAALLGLGVHDLGENRADVLEAKAGELVALGLAPRWHFVGHLQRNKAQAVVRHTALVHSVDSVRLLETLDRLAGEAGRELEVLAQVKLAEEPSKSGLDPRELAAFLARGRECAHVRVVGLMAMGPVDLDAGRQRDLARAVFRRAATLVREHEGGFARAPELSIGMSDDFEVAVEEGATLVRVGTLLFEGSAAAEREA